MYDGTLCTKGPWEALVTFQQFLVLADPEGQVDMTAEAISRRTTIPIEIIEKGIVALLKPDPKSRTPTEDGRRLIPLSEGRDWGWLVVNYKHYRDMKREEERREYHRAYWHKRKEKLNNSAKLNESQTDSTHSTNSTKSTETVDNRQYTETKTEDLPPPSGSADVVEVLTSNPENQKQPLPLKAPLLGSNGSWIWDAYSVAYLDRYGTAPIRNAMVNAMLAKVAKRLPAAEAPQVAAFYLRLNTPWYVQHRHPVSSLLKDCEGIRTQWATGNVATGLEARSAEQVDAVAEQIKRVGKRLEEKK